MGGTVTTTDDDPRDAQNASDMLKNLAFFSHDVSNNLSTISLQLALLHEQLLPESDRFASELAMVQAAWQSIEHTTRGMRRLLSYERLRRRASVGDDELETVDLARIVAGVLNQNALHARSKGIELSADVPPDAAVRSNADLIVIVLQNLVGNALKYGGRGTVNVTVRRPDVAGCAGWGIWVSDQGPGIRPDQLHRIFHAFERGPTHGQDGAGLGLAIAHEAAKCLGARLCVRSDLGVGSTFGLTLARRVAGGPNTYKHPRRRRTHVSHTCHQ
jgi:signal transduction histidine kinase